METLDRVKLALRITTDKLDTDIAADIAACVADLRVAGITYAAETDPLIFNAIKLWCKAYQTDDTTKTAEYLKRYEALKSSLMMAEGYGWEADDD